MGKIVVVSTGEEFMSYRNWLTASAVAAVAVFGAAALDTAQASHWRGGSISWTQGAGNTINFEVTTYWRRSFYGAPNVGDTVSGLTFFDFGEGPSVFISGEVESINFTNDWMKTTSSLSHTYTTNADITAAILDCCRLSNTGLNPHVNNPDESFRIETTIKGPGLGTDDSPNTGSSSPIFLVQDGGVQVFNPFTLSDPDGGSLTCSLASAAQGGGTFDPPAGLSINSSTCDVTWDTDVPPTLVGQLYSVSFLVTDDTGNTAPLDILLQVCTPTEPGCGGFQPPEVPEPGTLSILALGLIATAETIRRRRRKAA
jgi:hypothetical protein